MMTSPSSNTSNTNTTMNYYNSDRNQKKTPSGGAMQSFPTTPRTPQCSMIRPRRRPTLLITPVRRHASPMVSPCSITASARCRQGGDRFIPNRARRIDAPSLSNDHFDPNESRNDELTTLVKVQQAGYRHELRRVLFGDESASGRTSLLGFGGTGAKRGNVSSSSQSSMFNPMDLDILRTPWTTKKGYKDDPNVPRAVDLSRDFTLDMMGIDPRNDLHVMAVGPRIAVGIWDTVVFDEWGVMMSDHDNHSTKESTAWADRRSVQQLPPLHLSHMGNVSALKWRYQPGMEGRKYVLAVGGDRSVEVYDAAQNECLAELMDHMDTITSLEWIHGGDDGSVGNEYELLAASSVGIRRYDLRLPMPEVFTYNSTLDTCLHDAPAAKLQVQPQSGHLLAAAMPRKGMVGLWDMRYSRVPMQILEHEKTKDLEFCPRHRNTLATGGQGGVKLWNVQSTSIRSSFATKQPVSSLTWSPHRSEILAGSGQYLGLWSFSNSFTKVQRLERWMQPEVGPVVAVERLNNTSGTVLSLHSAGAAIRGGEGQEMMIGWKAFGPDPSRWNHVRGFKSTGTVLASPFSSVVR